MRGAFQWVLVTYGQEMIAYDKAGQEVGRGMAIVQPMTEIQWQISATSLGSYRKDSFLGLAQPGLTLDQVGAGGWVAWGGQCFEPLTVQPIWVGDQMTHQWIALRPILKEDVE